MKQQSIQKLFAFIITIMMLSVVPELVNAQCGGWNSRPCPKGYICLYGYCVKKNQGNGHLSVNNISVNKQLSVSGISSTAISFELAKAQNVSLKIYDITGKLIKTFADKEMSEEGHQLTWNTETIIPGIYFLRMETQCYAENKKFIVLK